jgi:acetylornithine deacetylase/succinyl-diaminopimelate desuccinylase-like protein
VNNNYVSSHGTAERTRHISELAELLRFPSISAQPAHATDVRRCAAWLADHLRGIGLQRAGVAPTRGLPIVYAETEQNSQRPTVLIYGHYDVQPADPLDEWRHPPFQPVVRGNNLYGRGASDDKGQLFAHVKAIEAYLRTAGALPVNVKCLFEGEEEIGSPNLPAFLARHRRKLRADVAVISDMAMLGPDQPAITYAMRGALNLEVEVSGPERDLHSGLFGGVVHNPLQALCEIIAQLHDTNGRIDIPGFYDAVRTWPAAERRFMARSGRTDEQILRDAGAPTVWGEPGFTLYERATIRPALSVTGIIGGYQGAGGKSVIPARATARLNFRLAPDQDPAEIERLVRRYVTAVTPPTVRSRVRKTVAAQPALVDRDHPAMEAAAAACERGFGARPVFLRSGGTIPVVNMLQEQLGIPTVLLGFALPDDRAHGPNEKFHLPTFFKAITTSIAFLAECGARLRPRSEPSRHGAGTRKAARARALP